MLPIVADLAVHMINRPRREIGGRTFEFVVEPAAKAHRCRRTERNTDHMLEHRPVLVPSDPRPDAILYDERLFERVGIDPGKASGAAADRVEPERDRLAGRETSGLEVIGERKRNRGESSHKSAARIPYH